MIYLPDTEDLFTAEEEEDFDQQVVSIDDSSSSQYRVPDILDHHTQPLFDTQRTTISSQQRSTVEKSREELMADIEKTIEQLVMSILVGEPIKLPLVVRKLTTSTGQK